MIEADDTATRALLQRVSAIAVVGLKTGTDDDAYQVPLYMQRAGYRILPVNPKLKTALGELAYPALSEAPGPIDLVNLFRATRFIPGHVDEILALPTPPLGVWLQLGIRDDGSAERLAAAGIEVVQDRCLMVEHRRLIGAG